MHINNNVAKIGIENILNQIGEVYTKIGDEVILYPLKIVSGIVDFTENGEFPLNYNIDNFTSNLGVITSNEPIVCYWEGAYKSYVPEIEGFPSQLKEMSAEKGRKVKTWIMQYATELLTGEQIINDKTYTTISLNRNIRSFSTDWNPTDNEMRNYLYLYLDKKAKSPQFLMMTSKEPRYLPGGKLAGCEMSFINLNQAYSQSGKDVLNFVKMVHPGGNYPFPKEVITENGVEVVLDEKRVNNRGVNDIQLQFYNSYWLNSITVWGAPKSNYLINAPRRLLLCNPHPAISSALDVDGSALNNYYAVFGAQTLYQSFWANWKDKCEAYYDYTKNKTFMGGWKIASNNWQDVVDTNPIASDTRTFNMWNNWTFHPKTDITFSTTETAFTDTSITFAQATAYKPEDFLNHNSFIFGAMEAMPMEFTDTTRYTLGDFGAIGRILQGFVQIFTLGFNPGWTTNNTWVPNKTINFLIPTTTFDFGRMMTSSGGGANDPIPFDCVNPDFSAGGNKTCVCGYRFQLTNYFQSPSQAIADAEVEGWGKNGIWDTKYLGQSKWEDGTWIFASHEPVKWKSDCKAISPIIENEEYEVYLASYKGIGLTTCRMTFYNYINDDPSNVESVWESRQLTNAKFKNDLTLWTNTYKLNFSEEMNNEGVIDYPTNIIPPSPQSQSIRFNEFEGIYNKDDKTKYYGWEKNFKGTLMENYDLSSGLNIYTVGKTKDYHQPAYGWANVCYILPLMFANSKTYDLTTKIGAERLSNYQSFKFKFSALHSDIYDYTKDVVVNISDLADDQWTKIKICDIGDLVNCANGDPYPRNLGKFPTEGGRQDYICYGNINGHYCYAPVANDVYAWFKLNKTTQVLELKFENPFGENLGTKIMTAPHNYYNPPQDYIFNDTIAKSAVTNDLTISLTKFKWENINIVKNDLRCPQIKLTKQQLDVGGTYTKWFACSSNKDWMFEYSISTTVTTSGDNYVLTHTVHLRDIHEQLLEIELEYWNDFIPKQTIRNINVENDQIIDQWHVEGLLYKDNTFFRGYEVKDFFINPNN